MARSVLEVKKIENQMEVNCILIELKEGSFDKVRWSNAQEAVITSIPKINQVHKIFKKETWLGGKEAPLLFDLSRINNEKSFS